MVVHKGVSLALVVSLISTSAGLAPYRAYGQMRGPARGAVSMPASGFAVPTLDGTLVPAAGLDLALDSAIELQVPGVDLDLQGPALDAPALEAPALEAVAASPAQAAPPDKKGLTAVLGAKVETVLTRIGWSVPNTSALPAQWAGTVGAPEARAAALAANKMADDGAKDDSEAAKDQAPPQPEAQSEEDEDPSKGHLVFDIHETDFKAGYVDATVWNAETPLNIPEGQGKKAQKRREQYIKGVAYRIAELREREAIGHAILKRAEGLSPAEIEDIVEPILSKLSVDYKDLRANRADADYVQGFLGGVNWRPGKQLWMPAPGFWSRLKPGLKARMRGRDARWLQGLKDSLKAKDPAILALFEEQMKEAPEVGTHEYAIKVGYALQEAYKDNYNKSLDEKVPFFPGKVRIPKSFLGLIVGHRIITIFGIYMHVAAQPFLVYGITGSKTMMGAIRNVHFGAYSVSNFLPIGPTIDKTDFRSTFIGTSLVRMLLMGAIPALYFSGYLTFAVLAAIVAINPIFQGLMTNSDAAGSDSFLGRDENVVREGNAFAAKVSAISGLAIPAVSAWFVSQLASEALFGPVGGYAMAYAGYAAMLLLAVPFYYYMVRDPRYHDPSITRKPKASMRQLFVPIAMVLSAPFYMARALWNKITGKKREVTAEKKAILEGAATRVVATEGLGRVKRVRERMARFFDRYEVTQGLSVILRSDTLFILMSVTAVELFISDALMFVVIPNYIIDVIQPRPELAGLPLIGSMLSTPVGIMGIMMTFASVGRYFGSRWISGPKGQARVKKYGHGRLYHAAAVSGLTFWGMLIPIFFMDGGTHTLPLFFVAMGILLVQEFLMAALATPLGIAMAPVKRKQIPNDMVGRVSSAFTMIDGALMAAGALGIGLVLDYVSITAALVIVASFITLTSILEWIMPKWLDKISPEGWEKGEKGKK